MKLDRDCITIAGAAMRSISPERAPLGRKPRKETENSRRMRHSRKKPMQAPEICPITVATAAPATPMSRPKMNTGSRTMFSTAPEPWTIIKPAGCPVVWSSRSVKNCMHMPMDAPQQMVRYSTPARATTGSPVDSRKNRGAPNRAKARNSSQHRV